MTLLHQMKHNHESLEVAAINPENEIVAKSLIQRHENLVIVESGGKAVIGSPGAIQADTVNIKTSRKRVTFRPPTGSIGNNPFMSSYIEYLIGKYKDYQKQHQEKDGNYKYMAIYNAIRREFGSKWQILPEEQFDFLRSYLCKRIDNTRIGRIRKKQHQRNYHFYEEHGARDEH